MSPSSFRALIDPSTRQHGQGATLDWEPDPLLGPADGRSIEERLESLDGGGFDAADAADPAQDHRASGAAGEGEATSKFGRFEPLGMEWLTGEPAHETRPSGLGDGLEFEPEPVFEDDTVDPDSDGDDPEGEAEADADPDALLDRDEGDIALAAHADQDPIAGGHEGSQDLREKRVGTGSFDEALGMPHGIEALPSEGGAGPEPEPLPVQAPAVIEPSEPMITEAEHLCVLEEAREGARAAGFAAGLAQGLEQGDARARAALKSQIDKRQQALDALIRSVTEASLDAVTLHAPLRRLAVHLAIELVRGELSQSSEAIGRLIETCLAEIDRAPGDHLVLAMHPDDLDRWVQRPAISLERVDLRADPSIGPGSVRLSAGDTVIEDLIEHRLAVLATRVLGESAAQRLPRLGALRARGFADGDIADVG